MTLYDLKPKFQNLLRPMVRMLREWGISPNQVTISTCILSIIVALFIYLSAGNLFFIMPIFLFLRMALNAIDGMLAKEFNLQSPLGAVLNEITDVIADGILYCSFIKLPFISSTLLLMVILFSSVVEITGLAALLNQKNRQFQGPMGKSDRAFAFGLMAVFVSCGVDSREFYLIALSLILVLLFKTIYNRILAAI